MFRICDNILRNASEHGMFQVPPLLQSTKDVTKCRSTCVSNNVTQLFGSAGVESKNVVIPDDAFGAGAHHIDGQISPGGDGGPW